MLFKLFLFTILTAVLTVASQRCDTPDPSQQQLDNVRSIFREEEARKAAGEPTVTGYINVDVVFHVVALSKKRSDGWVTKKTLDDQLAVMNSDYAPHGISFTLINTTRTVDEIWARDHKELQMKKALRQGDYKTLNVYFLANMSSLGYSYYPTFVAPGSNDFYYDGCTINFQTMPGGNLPRYNEGKTVTHEVGHWFHLFHTFFGGCSYPPNDWIADTPAERHPQFGCHEGRDSCPKKPGVDPIHNYMDYSDDSCMYEFTPDQRTRMYNAWNKWRITQ